MRRDPILRTKLIWQIELIPLRPLLKEIEFFLYLFFFPICMKKVLIITVR